MWETSWHLADIWLSAFWDVWALVDCEEEHPLTRSNFLTSALERESTICPTWLQAGSSASMTLSSTLGPHSIMEKNVLFLMTHCRVMCFTWIWVMDEWKTYCFNVVLMCCLHPLCLCCLRCLCHLLSSLVLHPPLKVFLGWVSHCVNHWQAHK